MKKLLLMIMFVIGVNGAVTHPGSDIVVDREGNIYFVDTGREHGKSTEKVT